MAQRSWALEQPRCVCCQSTDVTVRGVYRRAWDRRFQGGQYTEVISQQTEMVVQEIECRHCQKLFSITHEDSEETIAQRWLAEGMKSALEKGLVVVEQKSNKVN